MNLEDPSPSPRTLEHRLLRLLQAVRDTKDTSARAELNMLLRDIPEARPIMARLMVDEQTLISRLREDSIVELLEPAPTQKAAPKMQSRWFASRTLTAMSAGVFFGLFGASMVFGTGGRWTEKVRPLFAESFESGPVPLVTGVPQQPNQWSGDFSELVGEQQGVKPAHGTKMIRMLRADFEGKSVTKLSTYGDLMKIVDVRPFTRESNGGEIVLSASSAAGRRRCARWVSWPMMPSVALGGHHFADMDRGAHVIHEVCGEPHRVGQRCRGFVALWYATDGYFDDHELGAGGQLQPYR